MPLVTVTGGPTPPSGRTITTAKLIIRFDEAYSDGNNTYSTHHQAEYDTTNDRWKPLGSADGTIFEVPAGADGYPRPPGVVLVEQQTLDDGSVITSRRGPLRIYQSSVGAWAYGTPAPETIYVSDPDVPPAEAVLQTEKAAPNGVATLDGGGQVPEGQLAAARVLALLQTVDGIGSGLDADLLDGKEAAAFALLSGANFSAMPQVSSSPIVESGSNADGSWIRHADGTQICWRRDWSYTTDANGNVSWIFPAAFTLDTAYAFNGVVTAQTRILKEYRAGSTASSARVKITDMAGNNAGSEAVQVTVHAVGRWY